MSNSGLSDRTVAAIVSILDLPPLRFFSLSI